MKILMLFCFVVMACATYTDVNESLDLDSMLPDANKMRPYLDCYLDKQPCTDTAKAFKGNLKNIKLKICFL